MRLNIKYLQSIVFISVYLFGIYFWSQPYQERKIPYGEYDAMSHFEVADYMAFTDKSLVNLPAYIDLRYGQDNSFKPHTLWYPPPFHTALGIIEVIGGERIMPLFLLNTIMASFVVVAVYFVIISLFGFWPAILSSLLLIFSPRDFMPYLWGQWPERFAYAFVPIILYCFYKYFINFSKENKNPIYLYLASLFLGINLLIHPLIFFHSIVGLIVLYIFLSIKLKKFVFNWKHFSICAVIFLVLFLLFPYQTFNIFPRFGSKTSDGVQAEKSLDLSRLLHWSLNPSDYEGSVPASYFSFREMHGLWTLPFLLLGMSFLILRREERDIFMLAWLVSLYLVLHRDLAGKSQFLHRSLSASAHIFAPLTAIGAVYISSSIKLPANYNKYIKYSIVGFFVHHAFSIIMKNSLNILNKNTYNPNPIDGKLSPDFLKILTEPQFQAAQWVLENVPSTSSLSVLGIPHQSNFLPATAYKIRWFAAVSQHVTRFYYLREDKEEILKSKDWYIMLDYSMLAALNDRQTFDNMQEFEKTKLANHTLVYDKNSIRVYKFEPKKQ